MAVIPITLVGDNLGRRHQYLNKLVNDAFNNQLPFESIRDLPEATPVDRLFKIDLASKYKNVDFIIKCLKDPDMLYVSRALKSIRLLQNSDMLTPQYLEDILYPEMTVTATFKMKHCIALNLKHKEKCQQFYEYYKEKNLKHALKFFSKCSADYIVNNLGLIPFSNMTPHFTKLLCENTTLAAEALINILKTKNIELNEGNYNKDSESFMAQLKILLKSEPDRFFHLIENFYEPRFKRLNKRTTYYIMKHHRDRFEAKSELYTAKFLDLSMLSKFLNNVQIKELVTKLARCEFIESFYLNYKFAEPLLKRMDKTEKAQFCKKIFEAKDYGETIKTPPYFIPTDKCKPRIYCPRYDYNLETCTQDYCRMLKKRFISKKCFPMYSALDKLFDQYRFKGFDKTFTDFKKLILKESDLENRQNMFLVLISKTGGRAANLSSLMEFFIQKHANEPVSLRATIVRSLMKRACAWRMTSDDWDRLLTFGHGLGLDGSDPLAPCNEGLHGVVIHDLLQDGILSSAIIAVYLRDFVPLSDYFLTKDEKNQVVSSLITILLNDAKAKADLAPKRFVQILDTLNAYHLHLKHYPEVISVIKDTVSCNSAAYRELLERVFKLNVARQIFFKENFEINQTDQSYLNALKIDTHVLRTGDKFEALLDVDGAKQLQKFLRKLVVYFGEDGGLATSYLAAIKRKANMENPNLSTARTMILLSGSLGPQELHTLFENVEMNQNQKRYVAALWSNIHLARPRTFIQFKELKSKTATGNYIQTCSPLDLKENLSMMLLDPRLARQVLALRAPFTKGLIAETLPRAASGRRMRALQVALRILRCHSDAYGEEDWNAFKYLIDNTILLNKNQNVYLNLAKIDAIPENFKTDYCLTMYEALARAELGSDNGPSYMMVLSILPYLSDNLSKADNSRISVMIKNFLDNIFSISKLTTDNYDYNRFVNNFITIIAKFIILSTSDTETKHKIQNIARPFLSELKKGWNDSKELRDCLNTFVEPITDLKENFHPQKELMDVIVDFYDEVIPLKDNFEMNLMMRFTVLQSQAMNQCVLGQPKLFLNEIIDNEDSTKLFGISFATILLLDLDDMVSKYFDSIVAIYSEVLLSFIYNFRLKCKNTSWESFKISLVKTMLEDQSKSNGLLLGALLLSKLEFGHTDEECFKELISKINDNRINSIYSNKYDGHY